MGTQRRTASGGEVLCHGWNNKLLSAVERPLETGCEIQVPKGSLGRTELR